MDSVAAIAVVGTFDSKGEEHLFLKESIERRGLRTLTVNVGTKAPSAFRPDLDFFSEDQRDEYGKSSGRDEAIRSTILRAKEAIRRLHHEGKICGIISAGGGTGTHLGTSIMHALPLGVPKVMVSTVASRNMAQIVGTKDITMVHSVVDLLGVNSISGGILDRAAAAVCGMVKSRWNPRTEKKRVALTLFGFITRAAEFIRAFLEEMGYEVIPFHANGTGGMAMEELAEAGYFDGVLDLATHELADALKNGYCGGIGPARLEPIAGKDLPRLVVPGGLDCAVLEFTREAIPHEFRDRKIFFYDFRSAVRLTAEETGSLAAQLAGKLNRYTSPVLVLIPNRGWSEADHEGGPLYDPAVSAVFLRELERDLKPEVPIREADLHINDREFAQLAAHTMDEMVRAAFP